MPLQATSGAASYDGFGGGVVAEPNYIESCFSTYLYTGTGASQTITNGIDLAGKGGLVWNQSRSNSYGGYIYDTARGTNKRLQPFSTNAQFTATQDVTAFNSNGFTMGTEVGINGGSGQTYASWTFRKQPKFFDIVTFNGNDVNGRLISHNLGSAPGFIVIKATNANDNWAVWHRTLGDGGLRLNGTDAVGGSPSPLFYPYDSSVVTATTVKLNGVVSNVAGNSYVMYLFAHNAGGFGLTGTDNVISCGSYTGTSTVGNEINVGFEPQFIIIKRATGTAEHWQMFDNMRGIATGGNDAVLYPSLSNAEYAAANAIGLTATGFKIEGSGLNVSGDTYIYIAIRRGPMKVPTSGTSVFYPNASTGTITTGFPVDTMISAFRGGDTNNFNFVDRLRGFPSNNADTTNNKYIVSSSTVAETTTTTYTYGWTNTQYKLGLYGENLFYSLGRAPSFFDEVCYTGNDTAPMNVPHNLGVTPQLMIIKKRSGAEDWNVFNTVISDAYGGTGRLFLNKTDAYASTGWAAPIATSTAITLDTSYFLNQSGNTYVAYLFATCAGVSKVGTFTGNGSTQAIACGFTGGSRFVLIKATSTTGNWICVDTARGMTTSSNPVLYLNSNAAETATSGACITSTGGFTVDESKLAGVNTSGVSYIFLSYA